LTKSCPKKDYYPDKIQKKRPKTQNQKIGKFARKAKSYQKAVKKLSNKN
jgi:hypothetical protein